MKKPGAMSQQPAAKQKAASPVLQASGFRLQAARGFTLIELLVVVGIMIVITGLILANNNKYGGQVLLQNFAYDVALSVRQAQVYGIAVQGFGVSGSNNFKTGYGIHFDTSNQAYLTAIDIFADTNGNGLYDGTIGCPQTESASSEFVQCSSIGKNYYLSKLCAPAGTDAATCNAVSTLDIVFIRPEPDAWISADGIACVPGTGTNCQSSARIVVASPQGDTMSISVQGNGQISVDQKSVAQ